MTTNLVPISTEEARKLLDDIKAAAQMTVDLVIEAYQREVWAAAGYASWKECCEAEFRSMRLRLPQGERVELVAALREAGMSLRAIAAVTGESKSTVGRELSAPSVPNGTCATADEEEWPFSDRNPARVLGGQMTDDEWAALLEEARARPLDEDWCRFLASFPVPVFEAALALCAAMDPEHGASRENLERVLSVSSRRHN